MRALYLLLITLLIIQYVDSSDDNCFKSPASSSAECCAIGPNCCYKTDGDTPYCAPGSGCCPKNSEKYITISISSLILILFLI